MVINDNPLVFSGETTKHENRQCFWKIFISPLGEDNKIIKASIFLETVPGIF
jgi:hypothetical protein